MPMLLALLLASSVPPEGKPALQIIDRIEQALKRNRCVRPLSQWWRHYAFWHEGKTDPRFIAVWFIQAGHDRLPAGRFITAPEPPTLDDSQFRLVSGKYEIATDRFVQFKCGSNWGKR